LVLLLLSSSFGAITVCNTSLNIVIMMLLNSPLSSKKTTAPTFYLFLSLPEEMSLHILSFLTPHDICNLSMTSQTLKRFSNVNLLWRELCIHQHWIVPRSVVTESDSSFDFKTYYIEKHSLMKPGSLRWEERMKTHGTPPSKRFKHSSTVVGKNMILIGGQETDTKRFNDIIYFNSETKTFTQPVIRGDKVPNFSRHVSCLIGTRIFVFGGFDGFGTNFELSIFDPSSRTWTNVPTTQLKGSIPPSRTNAAAASVGNKMYLFGGNNNDESGMYQVLDDFNVLDAETMTWSKPPTTGCKPTARSGHTLTAIGKKLYLFGGGVWNERDGWVHKYNDLHVFDTETNHWSKPACEGKMDSSTFTISFAVGRFLFIFGGGSQPEHCVTNALYVLDTSSYTWTSPSVTGEKPLPRDMGTACVMNGNVFLVGGYAGGAVDYFNHLTIPNFC